MRGRQRKQVAAESTHYPRKSKSLALLAKESNDYWWTPFAGGRNLSFFKILPNYVDKGKEPGYSILPKPTYRDWIISAITLRHVWASPNTVWSFIALIMYFYFPYDLSRNSIASNAPISFEFFKSRFPLWFTVTFGYTTFWHVSLYYLNWAERPFIPNRSYNYDKVAHNIFYSCCGVIIWVLFENVFCYLWCSNKLSFMSDLEAFNTNWGLMNFLFGLVCIPLWRDFHFYFAHRLLHFRPLYMQVHSLHHRNTDIEPFAGLCMHPIEHLYYYSCILPSLVFYCSPFHFLWNGVHLLLAPGASHSGYEDHFQADAHHYLHHRYFECNYAGFGASALDITFGTFAEKFKEGSGNGKEMAKARDDSKSRLGIPTFEYILFLVSSCSCLMIWSYFAVSAARGLFSVSQKYAILLSLLAGFGPVIFAYIISLLFYKPNTVFADMKRDNMLANLFHFTVGTLFCSVPITKCDCRVDLHQMARCVASFYCPILKIPECTFNSTETPCTNDNINMIIASGLYPGITESSFDTCERLNFESAKSTYCLIKIDNVDKFANSKTYKQFCGPSSCSTTEMTQQWHSLFDYYNNQTLQNRKDVEPIFTIIAKIIEAKYHLNISLPNATLYDAEAFVCTGDNPNLWTYNGSACTIILVVILVLLTSFFSFSQACSNKDTLSWISTEGGVLLTEPLLPSPTTRKQEKNKEKEQSKEKSLSNAFNLEMNMERLLSLPKPSKLNEQLSVLNGIRVVSMCWIIMGHSMLGQMITKPLDENLRAQFAKQGAFTTWVFQIVPAAEFAVDTFFFMSGLLVVISLLSVSRKARDRVPFVLSVVHRYLRLTPSYAFMLVCFINIEPYIGNGPYWPIETQFGAPAKICPGNWWKNMLYINNFMGGPEGADCVGWAWYLANDMQFFLVTPLFIQIYLKNNKIGMIFVLVILFASMASSFYIAWNLDLSFNMLSPHYDDYEQNFYTKPWTRCPAYLIGLLYGFLLDEERIFAYMRIYRYSFFRFTIEAVTGVIMIALVFSTYYLYHDAPALLEYNTELGQKWLIRGGWSPLFTYTYIAFSRPLWVCCVASGLTLSIYGYGGLIRRFLSSKIFYPLARLTFGAYLWHNIFMDIIYASRRIPEFYSGWQIFIYTVLNCVCAYVISLIQYLIVEKPFMNLEEILLTKSPKLSKENNKVKSEVDKGN